MFKQGDSDKGKAVKWIRKVAGVGDQKLVLDELMALDYKPDRKDKVTAVHEGFAEFVRHYLTDEGAAEKAPTFYPHFQEWLSKNPKMESHFNQLQGMYSTWKSQGAEDRVTATVDMTGNAPDFRTLVQRAKEWTGTKLDWLKTRFVDELHTIEKFTDLVEKETGIKLPPSMNPFKLATYSKSKSSAIARTIVEKAMVDEHGNVIGKSLAEVLEPIAREDLMDQGPGKGAAFISYLISRRAVDLNKRGIESGIEISDAEYIIGKYEGQHPEWVKVAKDVHEWNTNLLDWLVRAGSLSAEEAKTIHDLNPMYVPFKRAFIDQMEGGAGVLGNVAKGVKKIKGSSRPIVNPLEAMIEQATKIVATAQRIRVSRAIATWAKIPNMGKIITEIPAPTTVQEISVEKLMNDKTLRRAFEEAGIEQDQIESMDTDVILSLFGKGSAYQGKDNVIAIWEDGKRKFYEVNQELFDAMMSVEPYNMELWERMLSPFSRALRLGATGLNATFGLIRNPFRDTLGYAVFSKRNTATIFDPIKGVYKDIFNEPGDVAWKFKAMGGDLSSMMGYDRAATMMVFDELLLEKLPAGTALKVVKHPIDAMRQMMQFTEMGPRIAELEATHAKMKKEHPEWTEEDIFIEAFNEAQDITVNFTRNGSIGKKINNVTAFFNASMQGLSKVNRSAQERPTAMFFKGLMWITSIALLSWWRNKDEQWYKNLPPEYRLNNFFFKVGDTVIRLPIPFELGTVFASLPTAALERAYNGDKEVWDATMGIAQKNIPIPMPTSFGPLIDVARNKNYLGRPIESEGLKWLPIEERKKSYTSKLATSLSKGAVAMGLKFSPVQMDYLIRNYTGGMPKNLGLTQTPAGSKDPANWPVVGGIVARSPEAPRAQLNRFYSIAFDRSLQQKKKRRQANPCREA